MDIQLKRGLTEICVLAMLTRGDSYGYQLAKDASRLMPMSESTLYPVLKRLTDSGKAATYTSEFNGRLRHYYRITDKGREQLTDFVKEWEELGKIYDLVVAIQNTENQGGTQT